MNVILFKKKVPVSSNYGFSIIDSVVAPHDYLDVSRQLLKTIEFKLRSARGDIIPLHGANISFSLIFAVMNELIN